MNVTVHQLSFSYHSHKVLENISFSLESGQLVCVLGANGAGKSTLFRCILQSLLPNSGRVCIDGIDVQTLSHRERAQRIAYIPQSHSPIFNYSVEEVVLMGTASQNRATQVPQQQSYHRMQQALERVGIAYLKEKGYAQISGGERQLVLIARALAQNASILLMDEPTSSLDFGNQVRILELMKDLAREGYLVIQSTHQPDHALAYADTVLILHEGKLIAQGRSEAVMTGTVLSQIYRIPIEIAPLANQRGRCCVVAHNHAVR